MTVPLIPAFYFVLHSIFRNFALVAHIRAGRASSTAEPATSLHQALPYAQPKLPVYERNLI